MKTIVWSTAWVTPRSWEDWITHYQRAGYDVVAPAYAGFEVEVEVEALNADPSPIENVAQASHLDEVMREPIANWRYARRMPNATRCCSTTSTRPSRRNGSRP